MKLKEWLRDPTASELPRYVGAFDILNIISCFAVVAMHTNVAFYNFSYDRYWITSSFIGALFDYAVPVFVMITGATLIDYRQRYSTREFFKKRVVRTFVPFLIWSVIGIVYMLLRDGLSFFGGRVTLAALADTLFNTRANANYWFFIMLFALYLSIPVISAIERNKRKKLFTYVILLAIFTNSILPLLCKLTGVPMNNDIKLPVAAGYVMYLLIGYCITRYPISKRVRLVIYGCGVLGFLMHFVGTTLLSYKKGVLDETFAGQLNLPAVIFSTAVFVWVFYNRHLPKNKKAIKAIRLLSGASFGVYLMHWFVIDATLQILAPNTMTWQWRVLGTIAVYLVCLAATLIIKKIPIIKNIVP